jgi:hypothetical protein
MVYDKKLKTVKCGKNYQDTNFQIKNKKDNSLLRRIRLAIMLVRKIVSTAVNAGTLMLALEAPSMQPSSDPNIYASVKKAKDTAAYEVESSIKTYIQQEVEDFEKRNNKKLTGKGAMPQINCLSAWICRYEKTVGI